MTEDPQDMQRPPGYAPRGTMMAIVGLPILTLSPFLTALSLAPVLRNGLEVWLDTMLPNLALCVPLVLTMALGLHKRRLWYVATMFVWGAASLVSYIVGLLIGLAVLFRLLPEVHPELRFLLIVNMLGWLAFTFCAYWTLRMLRLRYWQPWTRPTQWEPGDESQPRWTPRPAVGRPRVR